MKNGYYLVKNRQAVASYEFPENFAIGGGLAANIIALAEFIASNSAADWDMAILSLEHCELAILLNAKKKSSIHPATN